MRILVLCAGCLLFTAGYAQQNERENRSAGTEKTESLHAQKQGESRTDARAARRNRREEHAVCEKSGGALLHIAEPTYNFGNVPRKGGDLIRDFVFTNDGETPLVVTRVITSCSCLKASYSKRPVAPGGQGVIRITYEPHKSEPGAFYKVIQVYSNSTEGRTLITVQGSAYDEAKTTKIKVDGLKMKTRE